MNERIRELSEQAQLYARQGMAKTVIELKRYDADVASERYAKDFEQKFAELIVKECVNVLETEIGRLTEYGNSVDNEDYKYDVDICVQKCIDNIMNLKEHFGIK